MMARERRQIGEMKKACRLPLKDRIFPMEYVRDGISQWADSDDTLRETLVDRDAYLVMIEGMKKQPHVGPKLKDHYLDLFYTRFEQVKLRFVQELKERFEDRHAVETAGKTLKNLRVAEIDKLDMKVEDAKVVAFRARVTLSFKYGS